MKKTHKQLITLIIAGSLLFAGCSNSSEGVENSTEAENGSQTPFNLFKMMSEIRTNTNPQKAFLDFKQEYFKADNPLTLQFLVDYVNDKTDKPQVDLKLVNLEGDQLTIAGDPKLSTSENTIMMSSINCTQEEIKRMPRTIKAGINFIKKDDFTPVYPASTEFQKKIKAFNKQFGYDVLSSSSVLENEISYILTGNYKYWDTGGLYSEESFEKSKYSDDKELAKIKFYIEELESGSLNELFKLYQKEQIAIIDYDDASKKDALNPNTILTINGSVNTADFQYPLTDKREQPYAKLTLGLNESCKITDIKAQNKNFISMVQSSSTTGDGISTIKKKLEFYAKNKPSNNPNEEAEKDNSWEQNLNQ
ncbi:MAG: hypothetical protein H0W61_03280 [Bacteroidetes bacterium]|nr:hypothetical protein [Bacteroidota bacterium]